MLLLLLIDPYICSFELMLKHDRGNATRLEFLETLQGEPWEPIDTDEDTVKALHAELQPWATAQTQEVLKTLKIPTVAECPALLKAAHESGGISCLKDVYVVFTLCPV